MEPVTLILFIVGLVLLVVGADRLVHGASRLAGVLGVSPLVVGLTIVAYGTSAPEVAVSVTSAMEGQAALAFGNVVGSNIFNVLFILGISALIAPLVVAQQLVRVDVPLMIALSFLVYGFGYDGSVSRLEGMALVALAMGYTVFTIAQSRRESEPIKAEYAQEYGRTPKRSVNLPL